MPSPAARSTSSASCLPFGRGGDFAGLMARARRKSWRIVLLSPNLDTEDPAGKFTAHVLAAAAEYERDLIGARTREGMAQRRADGVKTRADILQEYLISQQTVGAAPASLATVLDEIELRGGIEAVLTTAGVTPSALATLRARAVAP